MSQLLSDLGLAVRALRRRRSYAAAVALTLGLGVAMNVVVLAVVGDLLWDPLPVTRPEELVRLYRHAPDAPLAYGPLRWSDVDALRAQATSFDRLATYVYEQVAVEDGTEHRFAIAELVSGNYFSCLDVSAARGKVFLDAEAQSPVAVLSYHAWQRHFGADPEVIDRPLRVNGSAYTVVGVAPEGFEGLIHGLSPEMWIPRRAARWSTAADPWGVARLEPGAGLEGARAEVALIEARTRHPSDGDSRLVALAAHDVRLLPQLDAALNGGAAVALFAVGLVLVLALVNVLHMVLARSWESRRDLATRAALGATSSATFRLLFCESLVLAALGGVLGLVLASPVMSALRALSLPVQVDLALVPRLDVRLLAWLAVVVLLLATGMAGAALASQRRHGLWEASLVGGRGGGSRGGRWGRVLTVAQVALSIVLLASAGLCLRGLRRAEHAHLGFEPRDAWVMTLGETRWGGRGIEEGEAFRTRLREAAEALPGVVAAGWASHLPLGVEFVNASVARGDGTTLVVDRADVSPGYFAAMGVDLLRGRGFAPSDTEESAPVIVVNETLARRLWPRESALGRSLSLGAGGHSARVIGVARDGVYRSLGEAPRAFVYRPMSQATEVFGGGVTTGTLSLIVRAPGDAQIASSLRRLVRELRPNAAVGRLGTLDAELGLALWLPRASVTFFGSLGLVACALAVAGVWGVLGFVMSLRRHELGVRLALGAAPADVQRLVLTDAAVRAGWGVVLGLLGSWGVTRLLSGILYATSPLDPLTLSSVSILVWLAAVLAASGPARRAARTSPVESLRAE